MTRSDREAVLRHRQPTAHRPASRSERVSRAVSVLCLATSIMFSTGEAMAIETLGDETIEQDGAFQVRRLNPHVVGGQEI